MVQLSVLALSNNAGLIIAWPLADKYAVNLAFGLATGKIGSNTTAVAVAEPTFPLASVAYNVIVFNPTSEHDTVLGEVE